MILQGRKSVPSLKSVLRQFRLYCQKPPKGFEKYFRPGGAPKKELSPKNESGKEVKHDVPPTSRPSASQSRQGPSRSQEQWPFGAFGGRPRCSSIY